MHFKKLELMGFKSFCDKTTLHFEPGITAVVGPNGCGKSNIFDSVRWVLGEQSAKSLRGSEMQDVIFNGTDLKEPLGMAEVTLTFDNETKFFSVDHPEVAITRRIFRSGESEYLLNKTPVRLKDILDILLGTGVGAESYSIVAQGKIDLVLSSRPEDRRLVFDEAAGITKYKSQKREATRKLEETEQNLLRVNDIVTEVKRQIGSLERQANKARRYKELFEELKLKEISLAVSQKNELTAQKDVIINQLKELEVKETDLFNIVRDQEARIANRQSELKSLEDNIMSIRNEMLNLESQVIRNAEHITFNKEKSLELLADKKYLEEQLAQTKTKLIQDEEKFNNVKSEYDGIKKNMETKVKILSENETLINNLTLSVKSSLEAIANFKKQIIELAAKIASVKNEISDFSSKQQIYLARKKRLEIEKAKVYEEKAMTEASLKSTMQEVESVKNMVSDLTLKISGLNEGLDKENTSLNALTQEITDLEKERFTLESHKEFLETLKTKYEGIGESMNAVIYLDKLPSENVSGLVVKIKNQFNLSEEESSGFESAGFKLAGEAKPIELDTQKIEDKIQSLGERLSVLKSQRQEKESSIEGFNKSINSLKQDLHTQEIALANKESGLATITEQFNKIQEEEDVIVIELQEVEKEISVLGDNMAVSSKRLAEVSKEQVSSSDSISKEEEAISKNSKLREGVLVVITQTKTELESLNKRVTSDEATLKILEGTFNQDKDSLTNIEKQIRENEAKHEALGSEIRECESRIGQFNTDIDNQKVLLAESEKNYKDVSAGASDVVKKIEADRKQLDALKQQLYDSQMQNKDIDYKINSMKERMLQAYKVDLGTQEPSQQEMEIGLLTEEIERLKEKLDSYGTVNLVAIEEYDELKKRYDFLIQQQTDLVTAKESLHQAILKINRTTKQMFMETFEKVREEFRNYFKLLFNGGDAQVFLIDENDPLESGIEIICRPPGKKLQNVLLLSGGEKSMSAIALIFAIFKVKPSPFCILDEIDAALDEANVDRFSRILQEFAKISQFIVITHNKKTIANASVMYGITMEQSGVSKIVSVKFAKDAKKDKEADAAAVAGPV